MIPSEDSGKRKASDNNSLNFNSAPKANQTCKVVSSWSLSGLSFHFADIESDSRAKAEGVWAAVVQLYNSHHDTVVRELEQWQNAKGEASRARRRPADHDPSLSRRHQLSSYAHLNPAQRMRRLRSAVGAQDNGGRRGGVRSLGRIRRSGEPSEDD